jgi:hypothetical protein
MTDEEFSAIWALLAAAYPTSKALGEEPTFSIYRRALSGAKVADVSQAVLRWIDREDFPPTVAQLLEETFAQHEARVMPALPSGEPVLDEAPRTMPWYYRLQWERLKDKKRAGTPLIEDQDSVRAECAARGIDIDSWPAAPDWYGTDTPMQVPDEDRHREGCWGLVLHEFEGRHTQAGPIVPVAVYAPCPVCEPGRRAVFDAGRYQGDWMRREEDVRIYVRAMLAADAPVGRYAGGERGVERMWDRITKDEASVRR